MLFEMNLLGTTLDYRSRPELLTSFSAKQRGSPHPPDSTGLVKLRLIDGL